MKEPHGIEDIKGIAAGMYGAGTDTVRQSPLPLMANASRKTWSTLGVFLLNMVLHPGIVRKAQEELDSVVGSDRLPQLGDREKLPYIECIVQETLRYVHLHLSEVFNSQMVPCCTFRPSSSLPQR